MTTTTLKKVKGVTEMTMEKHRFEGFAVRMIVRGNSFCRYVSASDRVRSNRTPEARKKAAHAEAIKRRKELEEHLGNPASWKGSQLRPDALLYLVKLGFKHKLV